MNTAIGRPLYIFDLDGTLALIEHRRHYVTGPFPSWRAFFAACVDDEPFVEVLETLQRLFLAGAEIWIWSGRSDEVRGQTEQWLFAHQVPFSAITSLRMRQAGDHQPDEKLKAAWLSEMNPADRTRLVAIFEDRNRMVKLWRDNGIACFQVAPGDF